MSATAQMPAKSCAFHQPVSKNCTVPFAVYIAPLSNPENPSEDGFRIQYV